MCRHVSPAFNEPLGRAGRFPGPPAWTPEERVPVLVLANDTWAPVVRLLLHTYAELWPEHPFCFFVPHHQLPQRTRKEGDRSGEQHVNDHLGQSQFVCAH